MSLNVVKENLNTFLEKQELFKLLESLFLKHTRKTFY